ncbi:hypothetical protein LJR034_007267 [Caballeronia sp. LjRoot34]|uniref:hypothetical protein n=1 Tax=Caballeronia sp. LjRoot34 TaxID=3342325 RepID=UPI003ECDE201
MKILGVFLGLFGALVGVAAMSILIGFWLENPVGLPCNVVSHDGILHIDGGFGTKAYLVNGSDAFLLAAGGSHPHGVVPMTLLKGLPSGSPMHVEFCGSQPVRLLSNGYEVFKLIQKQAEQNIAGGMATMGRVAVASFFAAILGILLIRRSSAS